MRERWTEATWSCRLVDTWFADGESAVPAFYKIDKGRRFVLSTVSGEITYAELVAHQRSLSADRDFDPTFSQIVDFTYGSLAKLSYEEVIKLAQRSVFSADARRALILPDLTDYGLGRMYQTLRGLQGQSGVRAFFTLEEALDWIAGEPSPGA